MFEEDCDNNSDIDVLCTPPNILETANLTTLNLLPEKSKKKYDLTYKTFMDWRNAKNVNSFSENVVLAYFSELANKYKSPTLWSFYSMLKSTFNLYENIDITRYHKLRAFLKRKSEGHIAKKSKTLTPDEINQFIIEAPDNIYLATKVALIIGLMGACRANELHLMNIADFNDLESTVIVKVPKTKTKIVRTFIITDPFYIIYKKYANLRPNNITQSSFFLNYQNGKCTSQKIGLNKFGAMGKQIANFLNLPNPELYTGHCFRRSSATILVDAGADITTLKRHGGWRSTTVAEGYIDDSVRNKINISNKITQSIHQTEVTPNASSKCTSTQKSYNVNENLTLESLPSFNFSLCSNFTINLNFNEPDK